MISIDELIKNTKIQTIPKEHLDNLNILLSRINFIRLNYNRPMVVTSGYRTMDDHLRIYKSKGITDPAKIPMKSKHLYGEACDISDPNKELQAWVLSNISILEESKLWCESFDYTPNWCHFQIVPPKLGNRFFIP